MAFNLGGLSAYLSAVPGGMQQGEFEQLRLLQLQRQLQDQQAQRQGQQLLLSGLPTPGAGGGGAGPSIGATAPQIGAGPAPPPPQPFGGGAPTPQGMPTAGAGAAPAPMGPAGGGDYPAAPGGQPAQPMGIPGGGLMAQLAAMKQRIMQANPDAPPQAVSEALRAGMELLKADNSQDTRLLIAQMTQQNGLWKTTETILGRLEGIEKEQAGAMERLKLQIGSRENIEGMRERTRQEAQQGQGNLSPESLTFLGESLRQGNLQQVNEVLGYSRNRAGLMNQIIGEAKRQDPSFDGKAAGGALAQFGGMKAGATVIGRTGASTEIGAEELKELVPKVKQTAARLDLGKYPTINAIDLAIQKGTGDEAAVQLNSYVQTVRNAYVQVMARGGRMSDTQRKYAAEIISGNLAPNQLAAALQAIQNEASIVQSATGKAMKNITGGGGAAAPGDDSGGWSIRPVQ